MHETVAIPPSYLPLVYLVVGFVVVTVLYVALKKLENRALRDDDPTNDDDLTEPIGWLASIGEWLREKLTGKRKP